MRALLFVLLTTTTTGCLWDDTPVQTPPSECAATTNPKECNTAFKR